MGRASSPKRGSMAYSPRKRASRIVPRISTWPKVEGEPKLLGFAGYKAGMTHVVLVEDRPNSPDYGREVVRAVTVLDTPPMLICAIRAYERTVDGLKAVAEAWMEKLPKDFERVFTVPEAFDTEGALEKIEQLIKEGRVHEIRVIAATQPRLAAVPKKKPDVMEIAVGGSVEEAFEYAKSILGKEVRVSDVFRPGEYVDVVAVTKGKGFQGPVKRWGVKIRPRKSRKMRRGVGSLGPWHPARVMPTVPLAGQMGFHKRTEYNKRILMIGSDGTEITPKGGFKRYGVVRGDFVLIAGSVPGPVKRLIRLRKAVRSPEQPETAPEITFIHSTWGGSWSGD